MTLNLALQVLADDNSVIAYRPKLAVCLGSVTAAILLQQILYRFVQNGREPFYKFREPCENELYKTDDSWCEELGFSVKQFDTALSVIGTKITKGASKAEAMSHKVDGDEFPKASLNYLVVYWTDSSRVTWYWLNWNLLGKCLNGIYLDKSTNGIYLQNAQTAETFSSKKTTKKTTETKRRSPSNGNKPTEINHDEIYWAIWNNWTTGDKTITNVRQWIGDADSHDIAAFAAWYKMKNPSLSMPLKEETVQRWWGDFRKAQAHNVKAIEKSEQRNLQAMILENGYDDSTNAL
jgi:hypothetical protein